MVNCVSPWKLRGILKILELGRRWSEDPQHNPLQNQSMSREPCRFGGKRWRLPLTLAGYAATTSLRLHVYVNNFILACRSV